MNPIDKIKKGIINNDMEQIIQGFQMLTGEEVRPEQEGKTEKPEPKEAVQPPVSVRSKDIDFSTKPKEGQDSQHGKREPIVVGKNQFVDDGTEDTDITTPEVKPTPRRPPVELVEVACHICGEKEEVNPKYKSGQFHRCGKCV